jgi:methionyl-tRNA formyltransferase
MKIVLWIGNEANQKALANKIHALFPVSGIITETRRSKPKRSPGKFIEKAVEKVLLRPIGEAWWGMKKYYGDRYPQYPDTKIIDVENINSQKSVDFTRELAPDLIIVSGTRLIKEQLLSLKPTIGILNLHTGLSPYIKGGPNCTNWCIATKQYHLIGNTIMWINAGIDTGNLVCTELTAFTGDESLLDIHIKVMEHAHALYLEAIQQVVNGTASNVNQHEIAKGKTYYTREWGLKEKVRLIANLSDFRKSVKAGIVARLQKAVKTVTRSASGS